MQTVQTVQTVPAMQNAGGQASSETQDPRFKSPCLSRSEPVPAHDSRLMLRWLLQRPRWLGQMCACAPRQDAGHRCWPVEQ